ncbi:MAG TPA: DUF305 domain-containing protein [Mycobacteriales bacterium]|nr:DUF305 domain-containing protein [Mycobacteriales bacterium]
MSKRTIATAVVAGALFGIAATGTAVAVVGDGGRGPAMGPPWAASSNQAWRADMPVDMPADMHHMMVSSEFDYLAQMIPHHQEAVVAARQLARSRRPEMRRFGETIVRTQSAEIRQMRSWLRTRYPGRSTKVDYHPMMRNLTKLSGDARDEAFLEDMIPHHMGAVMMSQQLLRRNLARHEDTRAFAERVRDTQHAEIMQMRQWLATWFGRGAHGGPGMGGGRGMPGGPGGMHGPGMHSGMYGGPPRG